MHGAPELPSRALYQRKKGRDLFDLSEALTRLKGIDPEKVVACFVAYLEGEGRRVTRAQANGISPRRFATRFSSATCHPFWRAGHRSIREVLSTEYEKRSLLEYLRGRRQRERRRAGADNDGVPLELVSKTSPKLWRTPGNSRGLERTRSATGGVVAEPLTDESRAPSVRWKSGSNESPLRHQPAFHVSLGILRLLNQLV